MNKINIIWDRYWMQLISMWQIWLREEDYVSYLFVCLQIAKDINQAPN